MNSFITKYGIAVVITALLVLLLRGDLFSSSAPIIAGQVFAIIISISARIAFRKQPFRVGAAPGGGVLIRKGPYSVLRHPMYAAALLFIWVSIAGHWSMVNASIGLAVTVFALVRISAEERLLRERYPDYTDYVKHTKKLIPFVF